MIYKIPGMAHEEVVQLQRGNPASENPLVINGSSMVIRYYRLYKPG